MAAEGVSLEIIILAIIVGTLAAIVYSLRILVLLERRIARVDLNIEKIARRIISEEMKIERQEALIQKRLGTKSIKRKKRRK